MGPARLDPPHRERAIEREEDQGSVHKKQQCRNSRDLGFSLFSFSENKLSERRLSLFEYAQTAIIILIMMIKIYLALFKLVLSMENCFLNMFLQSQHQN